MPNVCIVWLVAGMLLQAAEPPPPDLADADLVSATRLVCRGSAEAEAASRELLAGLETDGKQLVEITGAATADPPPEPGPLEALPDGDVALFEEEVARHEAYLEHLAARGPRLAVLTELADAVEGRLGGWPGAEEALADRVASGLELVAELAARTESGAIDAEQIALPDDLDLAGWRARLEAISAGAEDRAGRVDAVRSRLEAARSVLGTVTATSPEEIAAQASRRDHCDVLLSVKRIELAQRTELAGEGPDAVRTAVDRAAATYGDTGPAYLELRDRLTAERAELAALDAGIDELAAPQREDFDGGDGHAELQAARRSALLADAMLAYRHERLELLDQATARARALHEALDNARAGVVGHGRGIVDLRGAAQAAATMIETGALDEAAMPESVTLDMLWRELVEIAATEVGRLRAVADLGARIADTSAREIAVEAVAAQQQEVDGARATLAEEETFGAILDEMGSLDDATLLASIRSGGSIDQEIEAARTLLEEQTGQLDEALQAARDARRDLEGTDSPYAQLEIDSAPQRVGAIREELAAIHEAGEETGARLPADTSVDPERARQIAEYLRDSRTVADPEDDLSPSEAELSALERDQRETLDRLRYLGDLERLTARYRDAVAAHAALAASIDESLGVLEQLERRRHAAALELDARFGARRVPVFAVPEETTRWLERDAVEAAASNRRRERARLDESRTAFERDLARFDTFLQMTQWIERAGELTSEKVNLISRPVAHIRAARTEIEDLRDYERKDLEYQADALRADFASRNPIITAIAGAELRQRFEEPLEANYLVLVNLDRIQQEYRLAAKAFGELATVTAESASAIEAVVEVMGRSVASRLEDYQVARYHAAIAARPAVRVGYSSAFLNAFGASLREPVIDADRDHVHWASRLLAAEARIWGDRRWLATLEQQLSRLGIPSEVNRYNAHVAEIEAEITRLESTRTILQGRVDQLEADYEAQLRANGLRTGINIAIIPLIAFVLVRLFRMLFRRIGAREITGEEADSDRQRRLRTLTNVASASVSVVVWAIAIIYLLASIGVDVTPIVASASVAGLALAFGAQALIRDFFAGFFILLENQYTVGDVIDLGTAAGTVEHISMRVTTLRDLEGVVHYVPNGLVQRVSNKTKGWSRVVMDVQVGYREDVDRVIGILEGVLAELRSAVPFTGWIVEDPSVAGVQSMSESTVGIRLMVKTKAGRQWETGRELRRRVKQRFAEEGVEAPFPQRIIHHLREGEITPDPD